MTKFAKGDVVRVHATKFDGEKDNVDELGLTYSQRMLHDKKGEWCYGRISLVFTKKSRQPQKYKIKYHEGGSMDALEADIEMAPGEEEIARERAFSEVEGEGELNLDDREEEDGEDRHPLDRDEDGVDGSVELESEEDESGEDDTVTVGGVQYNINANKRRRVAVGEELGEEDIKMGATVTAGEYTWKRIEGIQEDGSEEI